MALTVRFGQAAREEKARILTEFVALAGYHGKHAARLFASKLEKTAS